MNLSKIFKTVAQERKAPDGSKYLALFLADESALAAELNISPRDVQIAALQEEVIPERYCRNRKSLSCTDQLKLLQSHVAIVGQGGLGGTVTEILARIGVGKLTLIDGDIFEESNLNRQLLSNTQNLGKNKAEAGQDRVNLINPAVEIQAITSYLTEENVSTLLAGANICVDCLDSIADRFVLEKGCVEKNIPLVTGAVGGVAGHIAVSYPENQIMKKIYGEGDLQSKKGIETKLGTLPFTAMMIGALECAEAVQLILRGSSRLQQKMVITNLDNYSIDEIIFPEK